MDDTAHPAEPAVANEAKAKKTPVHCEGSHYGFIAREWLPYMTQGRCARVFWLLCTYANRLGQCHPSIATIAEYTKMDRRDIQKTLRSLEEMGAITVTARVDNSSIYQLHPPPEGAGKTPASKRSGRNGQNTRPLSQKMGRALHPPPSG